MAAKSLPVEVPGEPAADTPESIKAKDETLNGLLRATSHLVGSNDAVDWSSLNQASAVQKDYLPVKDELPDQFDVDPATIKAPVLSKQGWVMPLDDPRARFAGR